LYISHDWQKARMNSGITYCIYHMIDKNPGWTPVWHIVYITWLTKSQDELLYSILYISHDWQKTRMNFGMTYCIYHIIDKRPGWTPVQHIVYITWLTKSKDELRYNIIQLMTFHKVDTVIYQPRGSDVHRGQWLRWTSLPRGW
jgi:hypothetical protein